jgi:hypothetical protein
MVIGVFETAPVGTGTAEGLTLEIPKAVSVNVPAVTVPPLGFVTVSAYVPAAAAGVPEAVSVGDAVKVNDVGLT